MSEPVKIKLPSGAVLTIQVAPFAVSKALYQAVLRQLVAVRISTTIELEEIFKNLFALGFSSPEIEHCIENCFAKCLYNGTRIDKDTFEPVANRDDYILVCVEVLKANVLPFVKSLFAEFGRYLKMAENSPALRPKTTT